MSAEFEIEYDEISLRRDIGALLSDVPLWNAVRSELNFSYILLCKGEANERTERSNGILPESEISEWKSSWHDDYMKWISAFAYTHGGVLHIGVNDDGYVVGLKDYKKLLEDLPNKFRDKLHITPDVRLKYTSTPGTNIRYPNGVPLSVGSRLVNRYICGDIVMLDENEKRKLEKIKSDNPLYRDPDGRYYYIEIEVKHYPGLVTYNGVQYTRSGSTLQIVEDAELERKILSLQDEKHNFYVNRVYPVFSVSDLRKDLIDRARRSAVSKRENHPWKYSSDEEILRSCGLILMRNMSNPPSGMGRME